MSRNPNPISRLSRRLFGHSVNAKKHLILDFPTHSSYSLLNDPNLLPIIDLLREHNPGLLFGLTTIGKTQERISELENNITRLSEDIRAFLAKFAQIKGAISNYPGYRIKEPQIVRRNPPEKPKKHKSEWLICIGLSFVLTIGICQFMGLEILYLTPWQLPVLLFAVTTGLSINLSEYLAIFRSNVSRRKLVKPEDGIKVFFNDPFVLLYLFTMALEISMAAPGLIEFLPPHLAEEIIPQISVYAAAGLAAFVNIFLAFADSQREIRYQIELSEYEQEYILGLKELEARGELERIRRANESIEIREESEVKVLRALYNQTRSQAEVLKEQKSQYELQLSHLRSSFKAAYLEWREELLDWLWVNPELISSRKYDFSSVNQVNENHSNGHVIRK